MISMVEERAGDDVGDEFELRLLRIPAVYSVNLWLHGTRSDYLVPLEPAPPSLESGTIYEPEDALDHLRHDATEVHRDELTGG
jgi:hypothetical protein